MKYEVKERGFCQQEKRLPASKLRKHDPMLDSCLQLYRSTRRYVIAAAHAIHYQAFPIGDAIVTVGLASRPANI